jgi:hypothetical protein
MSSSGEDSSEMFDYDSSTSVEEHRNRVSRARTCRTYTPFKVNNRRGGGEQVCADPAECIAQTEASDQFVVGR